MPQIKRSHHPLHCHAHNNLAETRSAAQTTGGT